MKTFKMVKYPNIKQQIFLQFFVKRFGIFLFTLFISTHGFAQNMASRRADSMGLGANLSHLENYWNGTPSKHYGDYVKTTEVTKRKQILFLGLSSKLC